MPKTLKPNGDNHQVIIDHFPWLLNGTIDEEDRIQVEAHLDECERCQGEFESLKQIRSSVKLAYEGETDLPSGHWERLQERMVKEGHWTPDHQSREPEELLPRMPDPRKPSWFRPLVFAGVPALLIFAVFIHISGEIGGNLQSVRKAQTEPIAPALPVIRIRFTEEATQREVWDVIDFFEGGKATLSSFNIGEYRVEVHKHFQDSQKELVLLIQEARKKYEATVKSIQWER